MKEKFQQIGKRASIILGGLTVRIEIIDYKYTYGRDRWLVSPIAGDGSVWVEKVIEIEKVEG